MSESEKIPAGDCPTCGVVAGDAVNFNFPNKSTCSNCGDELIVSGLATPEELEEYA